MHHFGRLCLFNTNSCTFGKPESNTNCVTNTNKFTITGPVK
jgi:hypothetical protein